MRAPLGSRGGMLSDFGVGMAAALGVGHPRRARVDALRRNHWPSAGAALDLDFINNQGYVYGQGIGRIQDLLTISGGAGGTVVDRTGVIVSASAPRFEFDPITSQALGLLVEEQRTNLLQNSTIDGANLATQSATVTAQAYTLSFYGTGTVTLSGAATGAKVGAGAYPTRSTFTFTPTAGTLTLTVAGTVPFAQLEAGSFATSYIPTPTGQVTRTQDALSSLGAKFSDWWRGAQEGTLYTEGVSIATIGSTDSSLADINQNAQNNSFRDAFGLSGTTAGALRRSASAFSNSRGESVIFRNGVMYSNSVGTAATSLPVVADRMNVGVGRLYYPVNAHIRRVCFWPREFSNGELQALTQ